MPGRPKRWQFQEPDSPVSGRLQAAPVGDEEGDGLGYLAHGLHLDPLVEAMHVDRVRSEISLLIEEALAERPGWFS